MVKKKLNDWTSFLSRFVQEVVGGSTVMVGILTLIPAIPNYSNFYMIIASLLLIGAGKFLLPSVNEFAAEKWNVHIPTWLRVAAFIVLVVCAFGIALYATQPYYE